MLVPVVMTFTKFYCHLSSAVFSGDTVFTVSLNGIDIWGACTIPPNTYDSNNTSVSISVSPGNWISVRVSNSSDSSTRAAHWALAE
jgi:hypothetical protein